MKNCCNQTVYVYCSFMYRYGSKFADTLAISKDPHKTAIYLTYITYLGPRHAQIQEIIQGGGGSRPDGQKAVWTTLFFVF